MTSAEDWPDPVLLYDIARGFLGLPHPDSVYRHVLLATMGACGSPSAVLLARRPDRTLVPVAARGEFAGVARRFRSTDSLEAALIAAGAPVEAARFRGLSPAARELGERFAASVWVPIVRPSGLVGLLGLGRRLGNETYGERERRLLGEIGELAALGWPTAEAPPESGAARGKLERGSAEALRRRHPALRAILGDGQDTADLMRELLAVAEVDLPVLLLGETGTGKELAARAIHELGPRRDEPFEAVNCAAVPPDLMASALFGHEKGAFTGAVSTLRGVFERAGRGTIFLDEIGDMPLESQAMLLRVIQERRFRRVGGERTLPAPARILSATNQDLAGAMAGGRFRADLFYRIQIYAIRLRPLREKRGEIPVLVEHILRRQAGDGQAGSRASRGFLEALSAMDLPGNVRELEGLVLSALVRAQGATVLTAAHLQQPPGRGGTSARARSDSPAGGGVPTYGDMEREYVRSVLRMTEGNKREAAALMGIPRTTLNARIRKLEISGDIPDR